MVRSLGVRWGLAEVRTFSIVTLRGENCSFSEGWDTLKRAGLLKSTQSFYRVRN